MKRNILVFALCIPWIVLAQNKNQNYVKETVHLDGTGTITNVKYFNGVGDLVEVASTGCGSGSSIFTFTTYDSKGRKRKVYNAVPHNDKSLDFQKKTDFEQTSYNFHKDNYAFNEIIYDTSDRIISESIGGKLWHTNTKNNTSTYGTNTVADKVIRYSDSVGKPISNQYYPAGSLGKETTKDADGNLLTTFTDLDGNTILERRNEGDTYYVYSKLGQLRYVLSPEYQNKGDIAAYAYQYEYDIRGNLVKKTLPGAKYVQYWYDKEGYLVFMQDAQLRRNQLYRFYLYDNYGRMVVSGTSPICKTDVENTIIRSSFSSNSTGFMNTGYNFNSDRISTVGTTIETVYYYDTYNFLNGCRSGDFKDITPTTKSGVNGLLAGSIVIASNGEYIYTVICYDSKGNPTSCLTKSINGYTAKITNTYSLTNKLKNTTSDVDVKYGAILKVSETNEYSSRNDRVSSKTISLSHGAGDCVTNIQYEYDPFNKIQKIIRPQKAGVVKYIYDDIHGWPTNIESNSFTENISYANGSGMPYYSGNISSIKWKTNNYKQERGYKFYYDNLNRLSNAIYGEGSSLTDAANRYNESVTYDLNSNITSLERHGKKQDGNYGVVDNLTITHNGNHLQDVADNAEKIVRNGAIDFNNATNKKSTYRYNDFGALISDTGRGISMIEYDNFMNPIRIQFNNGNVTKYIFSAEGLKLRTIYYTAMPNIHVGEGMTHNLTEAEILEVDSVDYLMSGNLILKNARIDTYLFDGGYCKTDAPSAVNTYIPASCDNDITSGQQDILKEWQEAIKEYQENDKFNFYYFNKDHLGNNREVTDIYGNISQETNYYPFGIPYFDETSTIDAGLQSFKYNEKEFDMMHGLNTYDYGARQYYPVVPSWDRMDPLCEMYYSTSPYSYCGGNPVNRIDPTGMDYWYTNNPDEIRNFMNSNYRAQSYDLSNWHRTSDVDFLANLHYNDQTNKYYYSYGTVKGGEFVCNCKTFDGYSPSIVDTEAWKWMSYGTIIGGLTGGPEYKLGKMFEEATKYFVFDKDYKYIATATDGHPMGSQYIRLGRLNHEFNVNSVARVGKVLRNTGRVSGILSGLMTTAEIYAGEKNLIGEGGLDLIMTGVGFIGPYGWAISSGYFLIKLTLENTGNDFWNK